MSEPRGRFFRLAFDDPLDIAARRPQIAAFHRSVNVDDPVML